MRTASWIFGLIFLAFVVGVFWFGPKELSPHQNRNLALIAALLAGVFGVFLSGGIVVKLKVKGLGQRMVTQAFGGAALFLVVLFWWQSGLGPTDLQPGPQFQGGKADLMGQARDQATVKQVRAGDIDSGGGSLVGGVDEPAKNERLDLKRKIATAAYLRGEIETAEAAVNEILSEDPDDLFALNQMGHIHSLRGKLDLAEKAYLRVLELATEVGDSESEAAAYGNLGLVYRKRGELDKAEEMHGKSLEIEEELGNKRGMAANYGNLGLIYQTRGELDKAEVMHSKSLEIEKQLGNKEGMAKDYGNLALVYQTRGDLDKAEAMHRKALAIDKQLGNKEGMAAQYGNLGIVYAERGDLDKAEEMHRKALKIDEEVGRKEGVASNYANLGVIYEQRGQVDKAREYWIKARDLFANIGMPHTVKEVQGWLDGLDEGEKE